MQSMVYNIAKMLFQSSLIDDVSSFMSGVFNALSNILNETFMSTILNSFAAIAVSLLLLYFFMGLVEQASKDMFSFEKLIIAMIKLFVAISVLLCLPTIISSLVDIGKYLYEWAINNESGGLRNTLFSSNETFKFDLGDGTIMDKFPSKKQIEDAELWEFSLGKLLDMFNLFFITLITSLINFIVKVAAYFLAISNSLAIIVRAFFSPIAVVQLFDESNRNAGIKYLKTFAAECIQMTGMVLTLYASSKLSSYLMADLYKSANGGMITMNGDVATVHLKKLEDAITFGNLHILVLPQFAAIGGMMGVSKITHDVIS